MNNFNKHILKFKDFKHWKIKDTYYFKKETGTHWFLKKYIVLYKNILVTKNRINTDTLNEIRNIFELFCNSIKNSLEKEKAYNFFFSPIDLRKKDSIVNFDYFNIFCISNKLIRSWIFYYQNYLNNGKTE